MAKILVKLSDVNADTPKEAWRKGDIISVQVDGFVFGKKECPPHFDIITVDAPVEQLQRFVDKWLNADGSIYRNSLYRWDFDKKTIIRKTDGLKINLKDLR